MKKLLRRQTMKITSLLLGSAAALAATTGARAADAVMTEPEAVEYVRVCDAFGAGYFYIPGTETCLKIGGYVRYQIDFASDDDGWRKLARAQLEIRQSPTQNLER
jgi:opacity protein-like surface antigen